MNLTGLRGEKRTRAQRAAGELIVDEIQRFLDNSLSPVTGKPLANKADGSTSQLFQEGDMRANITFLEHPMGVKVGIFKDAPEKERLKSHNHNTGNTLVERPFIAGASEDFVQEIMVKAQAVVNEIKNESDFKTAADLDAELENIGLPTRLDFEVL